MCSMTHKESNQTVLHTLHSPSHDVDMFDAPILRAQQRLSLHSLRRSELTSLIVCISLTNLLLGIHDERPTSDDRLV